MICRAEGKRIDLLQYTRTHSASKHDEELIDKTAQTVNVYFVRCLVSLICDKKHKQKSFFLSKSG